MSRGTESQMGAKYLGDPGTGGIGWDRSVEMQKFYH